MIRIVTDTASDITAAQAKELGIDLVPLVTEFEDGIFPMTSEADFDRFYEKLRDCKTLPITSRPSPQLYQDIYMEAKEKGDDVLVISLSSGISSTIESAFIAKELAEYDRVTVIDSEQAVMSQRILVEYAVKLRDEGKDIQEITEKVLDLRNRVTVVGIIGSLVYLRKGGRIPPALGLLGDALGIKPVITVENKVIEAFGKARGMKAGISMAYRHMELDSIDLDYPVCFGYTSSRELGESFMNNTMERFRIPQARLCQVSGIIGTHLGTDSIGVAYVKKN